MRELDGIGIGRRAERGEVATLIHRQASREKNGGIHRPAAEMSGLASIGIGRPLPDSKTNSRSVPESS